ncbi:MAG TPA: cupin domain-containing protein [Xanthobacteraceae bacterium]|nr:cupin domain-containing protein [Xanthobacteraceae bacterium]
MPDLSPPDRLAARLLRPGGAEVLDVMGPTIALLTEPAPEDSVPCVMQGTIPPGGVVPLHAHADPETFLAIEGEVEGLAEYPEGFRWVRIEPKEVFHVPGGAKHAFRNPTQQTAVMIVVSTSRLARFFREIGTPRPSGDGPPVRPGAERVRHFLDVAARYGYWNAGPEENAAVGISLPPV